MAAEALGYRDDQPKAPPDSPGESDKPEEDKSSTPAAAAGVGEPAATPAATPAAAPAATPAAAPAAAPAATPAATPAAAAAPAPAPALAAAAAVPAAATSPGAGASRCPIMGQLVLPLTLPQKAQAKLARQLNERQICVDGVRVAGNWFFASFDEVTLLAVLRYTHPSANGNVVRGNVQAQKFITGGINVEDHLDFHDKHPGCTITSEFAGDCKISEDMLASIFSRTVSELKSPDAKDMGKDLTVLASGDTPPRGLPCAAKCKGFTAKKTECYTCRCAFHERCHSQFAAYVGNCWYCGMPCLPPVVALRVKPPRAKAASVPLVTASSTGAGATEVSRLQVQVEQLTKAITAVQKPLPLPAPSQQQATVVSPTTSSKKERRANRRAEERSLNRADDRLKASRDHEVRMQTARDDVILRAHAGGATGKPHYVDHQPVPQYPTYTQYPPQHLPQYPQQQPQYLPQYPQQPQYLSPYAAPYPGQYLSYAQQIAPQHLQPSPGQYSSYPPPCSSQPQYPTPFMVLQQPPHLLQHPPLPVHPLPAAGAAAIAAGGKKRPCADLDSSASSPSGDSSESGAD